MQSGKINPYKAAALNMSKAVADDGILERIGSRKAEKKPQKPPEAKAHADEKPALEPAIDGEMPPVEPPTGDEEGFADRGLSSVERLERAFTSKNKKRSVELGSHGKFTPPNRRRDK